jgi:prolyl-tRNA editing enzyme YbaK/EbsC (Cys-tRNA(Pro) deacylase)
MTLDNQCILGLVPAKFRVSTSRVGKLLDIERPNVADKETTLELTGYPVGGVPFIGFSAKRLVDAKIIELEYIYTGGGSDRSLLKLWTSEIKKINPIIARIRK